MKIAVLLGTKRENNQSQKVSRLIANVGNELDDIETVLVDPLDYKLSLEGHFEDNDDEKYRELVKSCDAFFIVSPEYNRAPPGTLKNMLDTALKEYIHKPVAYAGVSSGPWGGTRVVETLIPLTRELGMAPTFAEVYITKVNDMFDDDGNIKEDLKESVEKRIKDAYSELVWFAKTMEWGRENLPNKHHQS